MYSSNLEDLVDAITDYIDINVPTYLTQINDLKADGVNLEAVREVAISDQDPYGAGIYPRVQLFPEQYEIEQISTGIDELSLRVIAIVAIEDSNRVKQLRYTEAVRQSLKDYYSLGESRFDVDKEMTVYNYPTDPDVGVAVSTVTFTVRVDIPA